MTRKSVPICRCCKKVANDTLSVLDGCCRPIAQRDLSCTRVRHVGAVFKKYHNKMGQKRCIWCPASLDRVLWGDEQKKEIKGFIKTSELQEVNKGMRVPF